MNATLPWINQKQIYKFVANAEITLHCMEDDESR